MVVKQAIPGQYFDCNTPLNAAEAKTFVDAGMLGVGRYVPRTPANIPGNLTNAEIDVLLDAGLSVFAVQHVSPDNWLATAALGLSYGAYAATYAKLIGLPALVSLFLDLEMVSPTSVASDIIAYCKAWFNEVSAAGYTPGIYVGWQSGLSDQELYDLPFISYWAGYNCDQSIPERGWQIRQHTAKVLNGISYDPNTVTADNKGSLPMFLFPS